jgi:hypothetical protein
MPRTLVPLSLGKLLDETFNIYRQNFLLFAGISAIPNIALLLLKFVFAGSIASDTKEVGASVLLAGLGTIFATIFVSSLVAAATTLGVSDIYLDTPTSIVACFSRVAGKALRVLYVSFVFGLIVGLASLLLIIPGIYVAGVYGIAVPAVVLESITGNEALSRSSSLTKGSVGRVIVVYFLTTIFTIGMVAVLDAVVEALGSTALHGTGIFSAEMFQELMATLGGILFGPITAIALTLVYYDQRVRKEAFDIEHMMSMMAAGNLASGASAK